MTNSFLLARRQGNPSVGNRLTLARRGGGFGLDDENERSRKKHMEIDAPPEKAIVTQARLVRDLTNAYNRSRGVSYWGVWFPIMPETKILKFLDDFPWVLNFVSLDDISQVFVSGIHPLMMNAPMHCLDGADHFMIREYAFLIDRNGKVVERQIERIGTRKKYFFWGPSIPTLKIEKVRGCVDIDETIIHRLKRLGETTVGNIEYVLSFHDWTKTVIVYRKPTDTTFWKLATG